MRQVRADEGFSLLEVLFAAFIAFFVLTALFGVLVMSASQTRISKTDTVATNLAQLCVEQARSIPYEQVGVLSPPSGQVQGSLESSETTTFQNVSFRIRRQVIWVADPLNPSGTGQDYKRLTVLVNDWANTRVTKVVADITDKKFVALPGPRVELFGKPAMVKPPNPVLFVSGGQSYVWDGDGILASDNLGVPSLQASASVESTGGKVIRIEFQVGNTSLGEAWTGSEVWKIYPYPSAYPIDLTQETSTGVKVFEEGTNIIRAVATGNNLGTSSDMVIITLDNTAGTFSAGASLTVGPPDKNADVYRGGIKLNWPKVMDGNEAVPYYDLGIQLYGASTVNTIPMAALGDTGSYVLGPEPPSSVATLTPFTIYNFRLFTRSVRGLPGNAIAADKKVTQPRLTGTVENQAPDKKTPPTYWINLAVSAPAPTNMASIIAPAVFPATSVIYYDVYSMDAATYTYPGTGDLPAGATSETSGKTRSTGQTGPTPISFGPKDNNCNKYFQVVARFVVSGTTRYTIKSNVVGPQPASGPPPFLTTKALPVPGVTP